MAWDPDAPRDVDRERITEVRSRIAELDASDADLNRTQLEALTARREATEMRELLARLTTTDLYDYR